MSNKHEWADLTAEGDDRKGKEHSFELPHHLRLFPPFNACKERKAPLKLHYII